MPAAFLTDGFREAVRWKQCDPLGPLYVCLHAHTHTPTHLSHTCTTHTPTHTHSSLSHTHPSSHLTHAHTCPSAHLSHTALYPSFEHLHTHTPTHPHTSAHLTVHQSIKHSLDLSAFFTFLDSHRGFTLCREAVGQNQLASPDTVSEYRVIREVMLISVLRVVFFKCC